MAEWEFTDAEITSHLAGIRWVSRNVNTIEHAAVHPFAQEIIGLDFDSISEISDRLEYIAGEFMLDPEGVVKAIEVARANQLEKEL